jgi:heme/copper-type cytochrome/quinol oxidase subunit 2
MSTAQSIFLLVGVVYCLTGLFVYFWVDHKATIQKQWPAFNRTHYLVSRWMGWCMFPAVPIFVLFWPVWLLLFLWKRQESADMSKDETKI